MKPAFLAVINTEPDNERTIARNAERVVTARLRDAMFFWEADRKATLESRLDRPASENVFAQAFKKMHYGTRQTAHGFRAIAATQLREMGWQNEIVEVQLAHTISSKARRAYDSAQYIEQRRVMMQKWSDFIDGLARPKLKSVAA